jgi:2-polyprenyl-3-methyl-5-hydroxy-6-metoxy-1,4-benzoquinol methylase
MMSKGGERSIVLRMDANRLSVFKDQLRKDMYPETLGDFHRAIIEERAPYFARTYCKAGGRILDVGCGTGAALEIFRNLGLSVTGIELGDEDYAICIQKGLPVERVDMHEMTFPDASFDAIWCRHTLEHSFMPFFLLAEFNRMLPVGGVIYIEVPTFGTDAHHEDNPNHYACMTPAVLEKLLGRAHFEVLEHDALTFEVGRGGMDQYQLFIARKKEDFYGLK